MSIPIQAACRKRATWPTKSYRKNWSENGAYRCLASHCSHCGQRLVNQRERHKRKSGKDCRDRKRFYPSPGILKSFRNSAYKAFFCPSSWTQKLWTQCRGATQATDRSTGAVSSNEALPTFRLHGMWTVGPQKCSGSLQPTEDFGHLRPNFSSKTVSSVNPSC